MSFLGDFHSEMNGFGVYYPNEDWSDELGVDMESFLSGDDIMSSTASMEFGTDLLSCELAGYDMAQFCFPDQYEVAEVDANGRQVEYPIIVPCGSVGNDVDQGDVGGADEVFIANVDVTDGQDVIVDSADGAVGEYTHSGHVLDDAGGDGGQAPVLQEHHSVNVQSRYSFLDHGTCLTMGYKGDVPSNLGLGRGYAFVPDMSYSHGDVCASEQMGHVGHFELVGISVKSFFSLLCKSPPCNVQLLHHVGLCDFMTIQHHTVRLSCLNIKFSIYVMDGIIRVVDMTHEGEFVPVFHIRCGRTVPTIYEDIIEQFPLFLGECGQLRCAKCAEEVWRSVSKHRVRYRIRMLCGADFQVPWE